MSSFDILGDHVIATEMGSVEISLAAHEDDSLSVVAWLRPVGRRVAYARWDRDQPTTTVIVAPEASGSGLAELIQTIICATSAPAAGALDDYCPTPARLASAHRMWERLGWRWRSDVQALCQQEEAR
jgi:hypothetical protein